MAKKSMIFPAALAVLFITSFIIISSPIGSKTIIPVTSEMLLTESKVLNMVASLPEVVKQTKTLEANDVKTVIDLESSPTADFPYYLVYFGEDLGDHTNIISRYQIDQNTGKIDRIAE